VWDEVLKSKSFRERRFSEVDKNGDGRVTQAELAAALPSSIAPAERRADTAARMVAAADKDGDGAISAREWTDAVRGMDRHYGAS
jgi:Ca2+-binding EF-hand superfamily protein